MASKARTKGYGKIPNKVKIHYQKTPQFRNIFVSGVYGGGGGNADSKKIFMSLFSDRMPIPQITVNMIKDGKVIGEEIQSEKVSKDGVIRDVEANLIMDLNTAKVLSQWLQGVISKLEGK